MTKNSDTEFIPCPSNVQPLSYQAVADTFTISFRENIDACYTALLDSLINDEDGDTSGRALKLRREFSERQDPNSEQYRIYTNYWKKRYAAERKKKKAASSSDLGQEDDKSEAIASSDTEAPTKKKTKVE